MGLFLLLTLLFFLLRFFFSLSLRPHSGMTRDTKLRVVLGTVDSGFRGEIVVLVDNIEVPKEASMQAQVIERGTSLAQGVIAPVETAHFVEVDELLDSERGVGGFGSTGVK
ncbi:hypothetical protein DN410_11625 [Bacillus sp. SH5-2]|nr:hypothetical protein DN410_11625 [Bacillus sp. SH5-2]